MDKSNNKSAADMTKKNRTEFAEDLNVNNEKKTKSTDMTAEKE